MNAAGIASSGLKSASAGSVYRTYGKRGLDLFLILLCLPVLIVLFVTISFLLLITGQRPFYAQKRVGLGGETFRMLKFQTMLPDADRLLEEHLAASPAAREEWDRFQKLQKDPRVTRLGRILRKSSLDELPQLINVIMGHMSLVGPRPMMMEQRALYPGSAYYRLRPGLTGPWQVTDRNACAFNDRAKYDAEYEATVSLSRDIVLLFSTIRVVLRGTGC